MITTVLSDVRKIDSGLFLECIPQKNYSEISRLLESDRVHMLAIFSCKEEIHYEYLDIGPGGKVGKLEEAMSFHPAGHRLRFVVPSPACPEESISSKIFSTTNIPYALSKVLPLGCTVSPNAERHKILKSMEPVRPAKESLVEISQNNRRIKIPQQQRPELKSATFAPLPEENPTDTLRRALHDVLSSITDREASLSVREAAISEKYVNYEARWREAEVVSNALAGRESSLVEREKALAAREARVTVSDAALNAMEEELKNRKNSVAFREKNIVNREKETEARSSEVGKRELLLAEAEGKLKSREAAIAEREEAYAEKANALAAEMANRDELARIRKENEDVREADLVAREKIVSERENTFKAETVALLKTLENITLTSRLSSLPKN